MLRLMCNVCGAKSIRIDTPTAITEKETEALEAFKAEHTATCAPDKILYPDGATQIEPDHIPQVGPFGSQPAKTLRSVLRPHGRVEMTGPYGEQATGDTLSCCHCGKHWIVRVGSGKERGYCARCDGYTCGAIECDLCVPVEQRRLNVALGLPVLTPAPIQIAAWRPDDQMLSPSLEIGFHGNSSGITQETGGDDCLPQKPGISPGIPLEPGPSGDEGSPSEGGQAPVGSADGDPG